MHMIESIQSMAQKDIEDLNVKYTREETSIIKEMEDKLKLSQQEKLHEVKDHLDLQYSRLKSSITLKTQKELLQMKNQKFLDYKETCKEEILLFRKSKDYKKYLEKALSKVNTPIKKIVVDYQDAELLNENVTLDEIPLGGVIIETERKIYDFRLEKRLEQAFLELQEQTKIEIGGQ